MRNLKIYVFLATLSILFPGQYASVISSDVHRDYEPRVTVGCYFSAEFQGEFVTQTNTVARFLDGVYREDEDRYGVRENNVGGASSNDSMRYSTIDITFNAIPAWGYCHKRVGENILLIGRYKGADCIRCFRLLRRSRNVMEVSFEDPNRCYSYESAALTSCDALNATSILYRTKDVGGVDVRNEYCPINGRYRFKYSINDGSETQIECDSFASQLHNCPEGSIMHLKFDRCSFESHDLSFDCLGSWPGPSGSHYVALLDNTTGGDNRPRYRCGIYHVDDKTGKTYVAFSSDSSCTRDLSNSTHGYETLILAKAVSQKRIPSYVETHVASFPKWAQGAWEQSLIVNGTMTFTDLNGYNSYTFVTVESNEETGRYIVYSRDQCEQEAYVCLMMKQRSENVLEFTIGMVLNPDYQSFLCDDPNFDKPVWMTQARMERAVESPCPITGRYTGTITDLAGMCAELSSNCNTREIMYFRVTDCESGELYEERQYLCLGQWEEKGAMYAYTMRNDTATNECFVGLIVSDDEIYIKEAGDHCIRNIDPKEQGMRLYKKGQCYGNSPSPAPVPANPISRDPIMRITSTPRTVPAGTTRSIMNNEVSSSVQINHHLSVPAMMSIIFLQIMLFITFG